MRVKITTTIVMMACVAVAQGQSKVMKNDSLMALAAKWRDATNYTEAINVYAQVKTDEARLAMADTYYEMGNIVAALDRAKWMIKDDKFELKDDARLIEARCRERQGFDSAAQRIYRKLARAGHAEASYYYASMMHKKGHLAKASALCQEAIRKQPSLTPAHLLLSETETMRGHRYQAMLPLMRYLLTASDEGRSQNAERIIEMWKKGWGGLDPLKTRQPEEVYSERMEIVIDSLSAAMKPKGSTPGDVIENLVERTDSLASYMRGTGEENLDFWQVTYADFLIELHARGYVRAMIYFIFNGTYKPEVLAWLSENAGYFEGFSVWLEGRAAGL